MDEFGVIPVLKEEVAQSNNSGYQAVALAGLLGAKSIVMLGFDMKAKGRENHWHPDHRGGTLTNPTKRNYLDWARHFDRLHERLKGEGVELVNATRDTALRVPQRSLEACLSD